MVSRGALLLASVLVSAVRADLPVHCLNHETVGVWRLHLGKDLRFDDDVESYEATCGHTNPDNAYRSVSPRRVGAIVETWDVHLSHPNKAVLVERATKEGAASSSGTVGASVGAIGTVGTWTMIYDEGVEVRIADRVFLAFFDFQPTPGRPVHIAVAGTFKDSTRKQFASFCNRTGAGWVTHYNSKGVTSGGSGGSGAALPGSVLATELGGVPPPPPVGTGDPSVRARAMCAGA